MSRVALVTGGSRGIGEAISKKLKADGCTVAATYAGNDEAAAKFTEETGIKTYKWNVANYEESKAGIEKVGGIHGLRHAYATHQLQGGLPLPDLQHYLGHTSIRTTMGYPAEDDELTILTDRLERRVDEVELKPACDVLTFAAVQRSLEQIHVEERLLEYCVALVRATRADAQLAVGSSPRGTLALVKLARASALMAGRDYVGPDDIRAMAVPALGHRVVLSDDAWARSLSSDEVVRRCVDTVAGPTVGIGTSTISGTASA